MNFRAFSRVKYNMRILRILKRLLPFVAVFCVIIAAFSVIITKKTDSAAGENKMLSLSVWQIDGFEGGKGSRATYLSEVSAEYSKSARVYVTVVSVTAEAARENLEKGIIPDAISYPAGAYGFESCLEDGKPYIWCHGGYCFLALDGADFSDISPENTVINAGKDNLSSVAALFCGVNGADVLPPTGAYVQLIGGKYKYLLGTQRDISRLTTRGADFEILPVTQFNDLYQIISVTSGDPVKRAAADGFIAALKAKPEGVKKLGLMSDGIKLHEGKLALMEGLTYDYEVKFPLSYATRDKIISAANSADLNSIKNLLK